MKSFLVIVAALAFGGAATFCGFATLLAIEFAVPAALNLGAAVYLARRADVEPK